jgi:F-type H+-transporting ATPase subunit gamma
MSQLIKIKQRISAIETIKKITHAMRLISMSSHTRMQNKSSYVRVSHTTVNDLVTLTCTAAPLWEWPLLHPLKGNDHLVLLAGSQKGLCGNFNNLLFTFFEKHVIKDPSLRSAQFITLGKKATDFLSADQNISIIQHHNTFSMLHLTSITDHITDHIINHQPAYSRITIISSRLKSFFIHQPHINTIVPFSAPPIPELYEPIRWEQNKHYLIDYISHEYLWINVYYYLFESLLAEQATRFLAMDTATRNAKQMLDDMNLMYNKLRQAKITRELTELMASF